MNYIIYKLLTNSTNKKDEIVQVETPRKIISRGISKEEADEMEKLFDANKPWDIYGEE